MRLRRNFLVLSLAVSYGLFASTLASASDESLSFRRTGSGAIEAIISGLTDTCDPVFLPPGDVAIEGTSIAITSVDETNMCGLPIFPPRAYIVAADLGNLMERSYHVVWTQAMDNGTTLQLSADLNPAAVGGGVQAVSAPALSWWGLAILGLSLGTLAARDRRRRSVAE